MKCPPIARVSKPKLEKDKAGLLKVCYAEWSSLLAENRTTDPATAKLREWDAHKSADPQSVSAPSFTPCVIITPYVCQMSPSPQHISHLCGYVGSSWGDASRRL